VGNRGRGGGETASTPHVSFHHAHGREEAAYDAINAGSASNVC